MLDGSHLDETALGSLTTEATCTCGVGTVCDFQLIFYGSNTREHRDIVKVQR